MPKLGKFKSPRYAVEIAALTTADYGSDTPDPDSIYTGKGEIKAFISLVYKTKGKEEIEWESISFVHNGKVEEAYNTALADVTQVCYEKGSCVVYDHYAKYLMKEWEKELGNEEY